MYCLRKEVSARYVKAHSADTTNQGFAETIHTLKVLASARNATRRIKPKLKVTIIAQALVCQKHLGIDGMIFHGKGFS